MERKAELPRSALNLAKFIIWKVVNRTALPLATPPSSIPHSLHLVLIPGTAVEQMSSGKTPGMDGLSTDLFEQFWDTMGSDLHCECFKTGPLPVACQRCPLPAAQEGDLALHGVRESRWTESFGPGSSQEGSWRRSYKVPLEKRTVNGALATNSYRAHLDPHIGGGGGGGLTRTHGVRGAGSEAPVTVLKGRSWRNTSTTGPGTTERPSGTGGPLGEFAAQWVLVESCWNLLSIVVVFCLFFCLRLLCFVWIIIYLLINGVFGCLFLIVCAIVK
ncbi:Transposon TX1 uncharacterized protein [Liparis tanakae]|uniref:Transposon TX1 uncharacterized protein n=1 Tax=Liparis tanakae TaxID=230148 RepID=A0A4Z2ERW1_9TELE|nr:Transposon TX1 uncharacterized protein [Liparis tanakae]